MRCDACLVNDFGDFGELLHFAVTLHVIDDKNFGSLNFLTQNRRSTLRLLGRRRVQAQAQEPSLRLQLSQLAVRLLSLSLSAQGWNCLFPTLGVWLLNFKLNSSPRPELFSSTGLLLARPWSARPQSVPGVPMPNPRVSLECPAQGVPGVPNPRVSLPREGGDVRSKIFQISCKNFVRK